MRKKDFQCSLCNEQVSRRQSLAVDIDKRACRKHPGTRAEALVFCEERRLARATK